MKKIKSQVAMEFLIFVGLGFIISIAFIAMTASQVKEISQNKEDILVKDLALKVQSELNLAAIVEDGYVREFELSEKLENINYTIFIISNTLVVESKNSVYFARVPSIIGNATKGKNKITKMENLIYFNE